MDDQPSPPQRAPALSTAGLVRLAEEVLPALIARLDVSDLGELEVRHDGWRVRLRRGVATPPAGASGTGHGGSTAAGAGTGATGTGDAPRHVATSPAVGYVSPNPRTPVGAAVASGDVVGWVEVLGVRQEVVVPADGVVGRLLVEPGQAVEYGQELVVIDVARRPGAPAAGAAPSGPASAAD